MTNDDLASRAARLIAALRESRKYGAVSEDALFRVAETACRGHRRDSDALKAAKRKLHQACGAFEAGNRDLVKVTRHLLEATPRDADPIVIRSALTPLLQHHASTHERLPFLDRYFREIFGITGLPRTLLDLGGGLGPLCRPWMGLAPDALILHRELDGHLVEVVTTVSAHFDWPIDSAVHDALSPTPLPTAEVTLLLKLLPLLERARKNSSLEVLRRIPSGFVVVSFPTQSLSGRNKGMATQYADFMDSLASSLDAMPTRINFPNELVYVWKVAVSA